MQATDVKAVLATAAEGTFLSITDFNNHSVSACDITGTSPVWEMHPDTDEFFCILAGDFEITLLCESSAEHHVAVAGSTFVVPKGVWHKPSAPHGAKFLFITPGESLHSDAHDPRVM